MKTGAWYIWGRLTKKLTQSVPDGATVNVFLSKANKDNLLSIWNAFEKDVLEAKGVKVIVHNID